jgi:hypothetical protein
MDAVLLNYPIPYALDGFEGVAASRAYKG